MTIFRALLISFSLFCLSTAMDCGGTVNGQSTEIVGKAESWAGKEVYLTAEKDPISRSLSIIDTDTIAPDGSFTLKTDTTEIVLYWIRVNRFKTPIWVEPGKEYAISIIPVPENKLVDTWQNGGFEYAFLTLDSTDINQELANFDTRYYNFYLDNAQFIGTSRLKSKVADFTQKEKPANTESFKAVYQEYTLAEMKLSSGYKKNELYDSYLKNQPIHFENPAYYNFFDLFYADYFQSYDSKFGGATIANRLKRGMPADSINTLLRLDSFLENDTIRQLVLLKSISEVYANSAYPIERLNQILDLLIQNPTSTEVFVIANRLKKKLSSLLIGNDFNNFITNWKPAKSSVTDTLPTVFIVSQEGSVESEKEASVLKSLQVKYSKFVHFAEIRIGNSSTEPTRPWPVFYPENKLEFLNQFKVYRFPHFIWVGGDGKIRENGVEKPSEGLEMRLFKIKADYDEKNKIKVGQ